jgi:molybdate transport system substrate-binding protein
MRALVVLLVVLASFGCRREDPKAGEREVMVAAATSLRAALPDLIAAFKKEHPRPTITAMYGASGDLEKKVRDGAPIDAVLFAAAEPVERLIQGGRVVEGSKRVVAHNRLVLIGKKGGPKITWSTLDQIGDEKLAIGNPDSVPAGTYAKKALIALGKWDKLQGKLVLAGDVAATLAYARRGEVAAAVVYATEVRGIEDVVVLEEARGSWAPRADVVVGVVKSTSSDNPANKFAEFLSTPAARAILESYGFEVGE